MPVDTANYEVTRQLGEGGVGRVYEAVHRPSGRVVAIKTLRTELRSAASQRLLVDEAAAAAQLAHPGIVELIDVGHDENGAMFLVMELVRGTSLEAWSTAFPGLATVLRGACEITSALAAAHAQGIVHGDLKPGNVLLTEDGRVKLTDFGIAHVIDPLRKAEKRGVQGTPYYMAPEQLVDLESISPPTDLYALGVMLYELLAGREPYASEGTLTEILARKLHHVQPFSARRGLVVSRELSQLVMDLLTPDPRLRPRFAARVQRTLESIAAHAHDDVLDADGVAAASLRTWVETPLVNAPTITSSDELPVSGMSTRSLPFSLPCIAGAAPELSLHRLRPLPLLGREAQVEKLRALVREVVGRGGVHGVIVSGRAGEGKTRLLRHGFSEVEREGTMIGAAASFDETIANAQVGLRAGITRLIGAPQPTLTETLAGSWQWLTRVPQPNVDFARMHEWLSPGSRTTELGAVSQVAAMCVLAASRVHPVYLWLDDVAWSRDGAMELMVRLLEEGAARALVVGTLRSGTAEHPTVRAWLLDAARAGAQLEMLPPLSAHDRVALFEAAGPIAPAVASQLGSAIDEPTIVLVEAVRAWIDEGLLVSSDVGYVLREGSNNDDLVARARGSVLSRRIVTLLEAFGDERAHAERVLCHAALLGLRFEEPVLRGCAGISSYVDRVLDRALLSGLLRVDGRGAYRFEHRMFLDVLVERCAKRADSAEIFCATADALTKNYGKRNFETGAATAMLYRVGHNRDAAAEILSFTIPALARANLFPAAERTIALFESWLEEDALPEGHRHRAMIERCRGVIAYHALDYPRARKHHERAREMFAAGGFTADVHRVLFDLSSTHFYQDHFGEAERLVDFVHGPIVDAAAHGRGHHRLSELASMRGDLDRSIVHESHACDAIGISDDDHFLAVARATLAELYLAAGRVDDAVLIANEGRDVAERLHDRLLLQDADRVLACLDATRGYYAAARARTIPRLAEMTSRGDQWHITAERALLLLCAAGLNEDVAPAAEAFIAAYERVPHDEAFTWVAVHKAEGLMRASGHDALATRVGALIDARKAHIAKCFDDSDPITEDEEDRSAAAKRASTQ